MKLLPRGWAIVSKNDDDDIVKAYFVGLILGLIIGMTMTFAFWANVHKQNIKDLKAQAIKSGHAEYTVDEFGSITFKFKEQ